MKNQYQFGISGVKKRIYLYSLSKLNCYIIFIFLSLSCGFNPCQGQERCGTNYYEAQNEYLPNSSLLKSTTDPRSTFEISVVFHIFTLINEDAIGPKVILDQIDILNNDYQGTSVSTDLLFPEIRSHVGRPSISYCLASIDPNGNSTNGIVYYSTPESTLADQKDANGNRSIKHSELGGADAWDTESYLNIWIGNREIFLGDATFPNQAGDDEDGIVMDGDVIGSHVDHLPKFDRGKTLVHEVGHYLGLKHLWDNDDLCETDDGVEDTPPQLGPYFGCPSYPQKSCGSLDFIYNFMDFSDDKCLLYFTEGQVDIIHNTLRTSRLGLSDNSCRPRSIESELDKILVTMSANTLRVTSENIDNVMNLTISIFDLSGKKIVQDVVTDQFIHHIELSRFSLGIYFALLENEIDRSVRKIFTSNY